jgi:hypothetical protein
MHTSLVVTFPLALLLAAVAPAQTTHLVGPGGFPQISDALAVAAPGDIVHVQAGSYYGFTATKGVTIRALGQVTVGDCVFLPPAGQTLHLVGLQAQTGTFHVAGGRVTMEGCVSYGLVSQPFSPPPLHVSNATVHLRDCYFSSNITVDTPGLLVENANVTIVGSTLRATGFGNPPPAVRVVGGQLHASSSHFETFATVLGGSACLQVSSGATVWVADSTLDAALGYCPLENFGAATVRLDRCTLSPASASCASGQPGNPLLGIGQAAPLQNGAPFTLDFHAAPATFVALHASTGLGTFPIPGLFEQPSALDLTNFWFVGLYVTDGAGNAGVTFNMPAGLFVDTPLWLEASTIEATFPWQIAPLAGGIVR